MAETGFVDEGSHGAGGTSGVIWGAAGHAARDVADLEALSAGGVQIEVSGTVGAVGGGCAVFAVGWARVAEAGGVQEEAGVAGSAGGVISRVAGGAASKGAFLEAGTSGGVQVPVGVAGSAGGVIRRVAGGAVSNVADLVAGTSGGVQVEVSRASLAGVAISADVAVGWASSASSVVRGNQEEASVAFSANGFAGFNAGFAVLDLAVGESTDEAASKDQGKEDLVH